MADFMRLGSSEFEVLERTDTNLRLKSTTTGMIRDADPLYAKMGFCTRQEYLCNILLHEPLRGYSENFKVVPVGVADESCPHCFYLAFIVCQVKLEPNLFRSALGHVLGQPEVFV